MWYDVRLNEGPIWLQNWREAREKGCVLASFFKYCVGVPTFKLSLDNVSAGLSSKCPPTVSLQGKNYWSCRQTRLNWRMIPVSSMVLNCLTSSTMMKRLQEQLLSSSDVAWLTLLKSNLLHNSFTNLTLS